MNHRLLPLLIASATLALSACSPAEPANQTTPSANTSSSLANSAATTTSDMATPITNLSIKKGDKLKSGMVISGQARGTWYSEGSFPVQLIDDKGVLLAVVPAQAQGEWMTEDFVPFSFTLTFTTRAWNGTLILKKDNPSDLPENDASLEIPVSF